MFTTLQRYLLLSLAALPLGGLLVNGQDADSETVMIGVPRLLIYSGTTGFRHDSIPTAIRVLKENQGIVGVTFDDTEDSADFTDENLARYDGLVFVSASGDPLTSAGKRALQSYFDAGGNFIGVHSASDCMLNTTFYIRQLGAGFDYHADLQQATVRVSPTSVDGVPMTHPSVRGLEQRWVVNDEMYNFRSDPRDLGAVVVLEADESTYTDNGVRRFDHGDPHPIAWYQEKAAGVSENGTAGRSFYTSLGHLNETWEDPQFYNHVLWGIWWAVHSNTTKASNLTASVGNPERIPWTEGNITNGGTKPDEDKEDGSNDARKMVGNGMAVAFVGLVLSSVLFLL